jgi:TonB family protein
MNDQWNHWEGQSVEGKFLLRQFLASTDHSAIYLTQLADPQPRDAVIKFIPADSPAAGARLDLWNQAAHLTHPNLLALYGSGHCRIGDQNFLYAVMEYAEENLAEILPHRALTSQEAREALDPALDVLVYLHSKGFGHGHLKPSNLLATQDRLKLSSDSLQMLGAVTQLSRPRDAYDAPELPSGRFTPKADVWSLGVTLFEALTQRVPDLPQNSSADPAIPENLPEPFRDLVRHTLRRQPEKRWSIGDIAARLNPAPLAAAAAVASASPAALPAISPLSVPLSQEPAIPAAKLPVAPALPAYPVFEAPKRRQSSASDYLIPVLLGAAILIGLIFAVPKMINIRSQSSTPQVAAAPDPSTPQKTEPVAKPTESSAPAAEPPAKNSAPEVSPNPPEAKAQPDSSAVAPTTPAPDPDPAPAPAAKTNSASAAESRGEVLDQVLPNAPPKALATIQGTLRVLVKVQVDAAGNVINSELENPGPSPYFAGLAEKAARQWKFSGAETDGHSTPSEWHIRFEFARSGVHAFPTQTTP